MRNSSHPDLQTNPKATWRQIVAEYEKPQLSRSSWQLINSLVPYVAIWALMVFSLKISYFLTLLLAIPSAGFLVRIFIISHDCGHGSFFKSVKMNTFWGAVTSTLTFTPYKAWRREHAQHHATSGNLDKRGDGDIWTLTVREYLALPLWRRLQYRLYRNPLVLFGIGPLYQFVVQHRFSPGKTPAQRQSVRITNIVLLMVILLAHVTIGLKAFILVQLPITVLASSVGAWMFYIQHQFEDVYWERQEAWDYLTQALEGSSYYRLPKVLQWFTGNIGFHHIHHLSARIPNYLLEKCHKENNLFSKVPEITLWKSLQSLKFRLWDEEHRQLVGFRHLRRRRIAM